MRYSMELESKYYSLNIDTEELIRLIPEKAWNKIEQKILQKAIDEYHIPFTSVDYYDQEDDKISFGVNT